MNRPETRAGSAGSPPRRLPPRPPFDPRLALLVGGLVALVVASFWTLDLPWRAFASHEAVASMGRFLGEFFPPELAPRFLARVGRAAWETLAMSAVGTALAAVAGLALALAASREVDDDGDGDGDGGNGGEGHGGRLAAGWTRASTRWLLNLLRSIPELVWAALLLISAGLGPFSGTLALALHTTGVLGRLFAEAIENAPPGPARGLRTHGAGRAQVFAYATAPQILPQLVSYTLYRWENNIRAASVLGVVGAGGLGQMLAFHMGLFQMGRTATVVGAMLLLVVVVDGASHLARRTLTR